MSSSRALVLALLSVSTLSAQAAPAAETRGCTLAVEEPSITYYAPNGATAYPTNPQPVNPRVLRLLESQGFKIARSGAAAYRMETEVRCGPMMTVWGPRDYCQTQVTFVKRSSGESVFQSPQTYPTPGLTIGFDAISFPRCQDLR